MIFRQLFDPESSTFTYLLGDESTGQAILIDPVLEQVDRDLDLLRDLNLDLVFCLDTHVHADHVTGAGVLRERTGCQTGVRADAGVSCTDQPLNDGDIVPFGRHAVEVRSTPGHTSGCATYVVRDGDQTMAFTGDTLFIDGCGRTDFQQGSPEHLYRSVHEKIYTLPDDTIVYPGHDYKGRTQSTVGKEKASNARLNMNVSEEEFVAIMNGLNLGLPKKIAVAVPANLGCGLPQQKGPSEVKEVSPQQAGDLCGYTLVDVREPHEWQGELGCIAQARKVPMASVPAAADAWDKTERLLIVCRSGRRSRSIAEALVSKGFTDVSNLTGGMIAWNAENKQGEA